MITDTAAFESFLRLSVADGDASPRTLASYRDGLAAFLAWCRASDVEASAATFNQVQAYRRHMVDRRLSRATIRQRLTVCRILFRSLQRAGLRSDNPADGVRAPKPSSSEADSVLEKALSPEEAAHLAAHLERASASFQGARDRAIILLMMLHGLRASEVRAMRAGDIDTRAFLRLQVHGKGRKERQVILDSVTRGALMDYLSRAGDLAGGPVFFRSELPAADLAGEKPAASPLAVRSIEAIVDRHLSALDMKRPGRSAHALRHTAGILARLGGAEREAIQAAFGHSSARMTDHYLSAASRYQENAGAAAGRALEAARAAVRTSDHAEVIHRQEGCEGAPALDLMTPRPKGTQVHILSPWPSLDAQSEGPASPQGADGA